MMVGTDDGQVLLWGYSNNNNLGHATATWSSTGRSMMWNRVLVDNINIRKVI